MNHSTLLVTRRLLWCVAIITFVVSLSAKAGGRDKVAVDRNLTKEQLVSRYTFFHGDSLASFDYVATYRKALDVSGIQLEQELKSFFGIAERKFVNKKYNIAEIEPQRPGRDYRNPLTAVCNNLDFEYGNWTGWNGAGGINTNSAGPLTVTAPGIIDGNLCNAVSACQYHTLCNTTCPNDPYSNLSVVDPGGGNYTARLGGDQINLYEGYCNLPTQDWTYSSGEFIEQTIYVTLANALFTYSYQVILEDAPHAAGENPYFHAEVFDSLGNSISSCFEYYVQSLPNTGGPPPGFFASSVWGYSYLPWTQNSINLTAFLYSNVTVRFTTAGCLYGGHSAHSYVDVSCSPVQIVVTDGMIPCNGTTTLIAPPAAGGTYTWAGPGIVGSNTSQIITVNAAGHYTVTIHPTTGCDYTLATDVTAAAAINGTMNHANVRCNGANQGVAWTAPIGGTAPFTYAWTASAATTATVSNLPAGTYTATITDVNGCTYIGTTTITQPNALNVNTNPTNLRCYNVAQGAAIVNVGGGTAPYSYLWTPSSQTGITASNLSAGNYTVTVTDAYGCTRVSAVQVTQPTQLMAPTTPSPVSCNGGSNGRVIVTPNGGTGPYQYVWSPSGGTSSTATNLTAGNWTVTVTDANGCTRVSIAAVTQPTPVTSTVSGTPVSCFGGSNGTSTASANGGTTPYSYLWSSGATTITANNLAAGNYTCTITDNHGCSVLQPYTVTQPTAVAAAANHTNVSCNGGNNGTASASGSGGIGPYAYQWTPSGGTNAMANGLTIGTYTVRVTDANGCTNTTTVVITEPTALSAPTGNTNVSCYAGADASAWVTPGGGVGPYTYLWTPSAQTTQTASNLLATNYIVRVTDANGCTITSVLTPTQPLLLTASTSQTHVSCNGGADGTASVVANYGTAPYTYLWNPSGQTNSTANNLAAGAYTVLVTDANGCTTIKSTVINEPTVLTAVANYSNVNCNGASTGSTSVVPGGGTPPYSYLWSSGNTTATANNLPAGPYTVTVTDAHGCTQTATTSITEPTAMSASTANTNVTCFGLSNGSATVNVGGGVLPYTYLWNPSGQTTAIANNIPAGSYTVGIIDANGCTLTTSVVVTEPALLTAATSPPTNITCYGFANGSAYVTAGGGTLPYTYLWSPSGQTSQTANNLDAANYTVRVTDANGCSLTSNVLITQPPALTVSTSNTNVSCFGLSDGSATVTAGGGVSPYSYAWNTSPVQTTALASNIPAGTYTIGITDANGCVISSTATVTEPTELLSSTLPTNNVCFGQNNGTATVVPSGGTSPYTYLWSDNNNQTTATANNLFAGTYTATVLDAHGCLSYATATITEPPLLVAAIPWHTDNLCYGDQLGTAYVAVNGGIPSYQYAWSPAGGTNATAAGMGAGNYTVIITDVNGCTTKQLVQITEPPQLMMTVNTPPTICIGQSTDINATVWGGTPPYNYSWNNGPIDSTQNVSPGTTTIYNVNVTDANGCTIPAQTITVEVYPPLQLNAVGPPDVCSGTAVTLNSNGSGGNGGPYTYTWSNGETTSSITLTITQDTSMTVTFSDGCSPSQQANLSVINNPVPVVNFSPWVTSGCAPLTVDFVDSSIAVSGATYAWTLGDGTSSNTTNFTHVYPNPGVYDISLTVTTPANCTSSLALPHVVEVFPLPEANFATSSEVVEYEYPFIDFSNFSSDADYWHWDFGDGSTDTGTFSPTHQYRDTGYYNIQLAVMNDHGCVDTVYGRIYVRPEWSIFIPNNFTPNGDGINDYFNALGTNIIEYDMWILDRWGGKIYHSESMSQSWNGTYYNNGTLCQTDVYVYKIKARDIHGKMHTFIGHVTLWR